MKRRKSSETYRKERIIMIACSVLVLTAMTVTGISIYQNNQAEKQEENIVDFSALEDDGAQDQPLAQAQNSDVENFTSNNDSGELDYDPYYAAQDALLNGVKSSGEEESGSEQDDSKTAKHDTEESAGESESGTESDTEETGTVGYSEISGGTVVSGQADTASVHENSVGTDTDEMEGNVQTADNEALEAVANAVQEEMNLHFDEDADLTWPIIGNVVLNYSMDKTVYFQTLQQYKYNPAIMIGATQGTNVACAADGVVRSIYEDPQTGITVVMNLGDGYELTYGQLTDLTVEEGDFVENGVFIGKVAAPTKYYSKEGTNVYIKLTKDQEPVNPLDYLG